MPIIMPKIYLFLFVLLFYGVIVRSENNAWKQEIALPMFVEDYLFNNEYTRQKKSESEEQSMKFIITITGPGLNAFQKILQAVARKSMHRPGVEVGPGAYKNDIVTYPPNKFKDDLKKLLKLKQKMEESKN